MKGVRNLELDERTLLSILNLLNFPQHSNTSRQPSLHIQNLNTAHPTRELLLVEPVSRATDNLTEMPSPNPAPPLLPPAVLRIQRSVGGWDNKGKGKAKQPMDPALLNVSLETTRDGL